VKRARTRSNPLVEDKRSEDEFSDLQGVCFLELKQLVSMCVIRFNETRSNSGRINKHMTIGFQDGMELCPHSPDLYLVLAPHGIHNNVRPCRLVMRGLMSENMVGPIMVSEQGRLYVTISDLHPHSIYRLVLSHLRLPSVKHFQKIDICHTLTLCSQHMMTKYSSS
jgi:hypothetical protein